MTATNVCVSGSMRFFVHMLQCAIDEILAGNVVLMPFAVAATDSATKARLDMLHLRKIDQSARLVVVTDESGYFGDSTRNEILYANEQSKPMEMRRYRAEWVGGFPWRQRTVLIDTPELIVCLTHGEPEPALPGDYKCCAECLHVWRTHADFLADIREMHRSYGWPYREGESEFCCPLCTHDF